MKHRKRFDLRISCPQQYRSERFCFWHLTLGFCSWSMKKIHITFTNQNESSLKLYLSCRCSLIDAFFMMRFLCFVERDMLQKVIRNVHTNVMRKRNVIASEWRFAGRDNCQFCCFVVYAFVTRKLFPIRTSGAYSI